jgi:NADH dehydrogenase
VVIVGGGFGGLYCARALARHPLRITLLDQHNYHLFQPLLYQVATAALSPGQIASPIRSILRRHRNVQVLLGTATAVDAPGRRVLLEDGGVVRYDYLVLATGARHGYFGHDEWEPLAPGLKWLDDALEMRRRLLWAFEAAEREPDAAAREAWLTFVIVGAGPTGVELAGAIAEIGRHTLARDFRHIDPAQSRVLLLEGAPRVLPPFPEDLSASAERQLRALGVEVRTGAMVTDITPESVRVGDEVIPTRTVFWAAGNAASPLGKTLGVPLDRAGRVIVEPDLTVPGHPEVYAIGDLAVFTHQTGKPLPGVAPVAVQGGEVAADNIWRSVSGQERLRFHYTDRGNLATIGRQAGVADLHLVHLDGFVAWLAWLFVHVFWLIGFPNRVLVMLQWAWSYLTYERGARLITGPPPRPLAPGPESAAPKGGAEHGAR